MVPPRVDGSMEIIRSFAELQLAQSCLQPIGELLLNPPFNATVSFGNGRTLDALPTTLPSVGIGVATNSKGHIFVYTRSQETRLFEFDQKDTLALSVLRDLQEVEHAKEARRDRQLWSDVRETDRLDRINLDLTLFHLIPRAHLDVRTHPYPDAARDFPSTYSVAQSSREDQAVVRRRFCAARKDVTP